MSGKRFDLKPFSVGRCFYYLTNGVVLFAEGDAVKRTGDQDYTFDCNQTVMCLFATGSDVKGNPNPPQFILMHAAFPGHPTFYIAEKKDVRGISDCTDEALAMQIRAKRAGLELVRNSTPILTPDFPGEER